MAKRLWIFGILLGVALLVFGYFVNALDPLGIVEFDKEYAVMDLRSHLAKDELSEFDLILALRSGGISNLLLAADSYLIGYKVPVSPTNALECFSKVLTKDPKNPRAQMGMAVCHYVGNGVPRDLDKAADFGWRALSSAAERKDEPYLAVEDNSFATMLVMLVKLDHFGHWMHEKPKAEKSLPRLGVPPVLFLCIFGLVFVVQCFKKKDPEDIVDTPWRFALAENILGSAFIAITLMIMFYCGMTGHTALLSLLWILWPFSFQGQYVLPFCVLGVWLLHCVCLCGIPFFNFVPAWNKIPLFYLTEYGNLIMGNGFYMSVRFPDVCTAFNGAYLYWALFVCAVLMSVLRLSVGALLHEENGRSKLGNDTIGLRMKILGSNSIMLLFSLITFATLCLVGLIVCFEH